MKRDNSKRESNSVRALDRGIQVLLALEAAGRPLSLTELRRATQLTNATLLRMLSTLERYGLTEKGAGGYRLGVAILPLAYGFLRGNELTLAAFPVLQDLAHRTKETTSLFVRHGFHRIVVQRVEGQYPLRYFLPIGQRLPLYLGMGKVLAAAMPEAELKQMVEQVGEMHFANGKRLTRKDLLEELDRVRRQGFSLSINERVMGSASAAAPVITASGATIAAVGVIGTAERMHENKLRALSVEVRRAAKAIAEQCSNARDR